MPVAALLGGMLLWGSSFIAMKVAVMAFHPMLVILARMTIASLLFSLAWRGLRHVHYHKGDWRLFLFMGLCEPGLYFIFEGYALRYTSASQAGMVAAILPVLVAVLAWFSLRERLTPQAKAGLLLSVAGVVWLSTAGQATEHAPNPVLGNTLEFLAMTSAAGYMVTLKHLTSRYPSFFLTAVQAFVGVLFFSPSLLLPGAELPDPMPFWGLVAVLYLGSFVTVGAYGLYNFGMSRLPATQASAYTNLIPVISLILGQAMLGETFTRPQYLASVLVLVGVFLTQKGMPRSRPSPSGREERRSLFPGLRA